jgi:CDP-diacylglycerol--glycerol-3-phosphate 3-phosphatidyltransferase
MGVYSVKPRFQAILKPVASYLAEQEVHPTWINLAAVISSVFAGFLLFDATTTVWSLLIPLLVFIRIALNALDGMVARANKVNEQARGEFLNEFFDRVSDTAIFLGLTFNPATSILLGVATITVLLLTSYVSIVSKAAGGSRRYEGVMGKADRMLVIGFLGCLTPWFGVSTFGDGALSVVLAGLTLTISQRITATWGELSGR